MKRLNDFYDRMLLQHQKHFSLVVYLMCIFYALLLLCSCLDVPFLRGQLRSNIRPCPAGTDLVLSLLRSNIRPCPTESSGSAPRHEDRRTYIQDLILIEIVFEFLDFTHMPDEHTSCQLNSALLYSVHGYARARTSMLYVIRS
jgi:hypothetical protein